MPGNNKWTIVGLGEILWDMLPGGKKLGGAPANFAYHASALGADAAVVSCVGRDPLGCEIVERLASLGLSSRYIATTYEYPTGTVDVKIDAAGVPEYIIHENVAWDYIPLTDDLLELAARADAVCFGTLCQRSPVSRNTIRRFLQATRTDCLRVFDVNLRQHYYDEATLDESLALANVVKLNNDEMAVMAKKFGRTFTQAAAGGAMNVLAMTLGDNGSLLSRETEESKQQAAAVKVVDTVGAGDAFTAALAVGLLGKLDLETINRAATRLAGYVCTQPGATPVVPPELLATLFGKPEEE